MLNTNEGQLKQIVNSQFKNTYSESVTITWNKLHATKHFRILINREPVLILRLNNKSIVKYRYYYVEFDEINGVYCTNIRFEMNVKDL